MQRRSFLKFLGIGAAAPVAVSASEKFAETAKKLDATAPVKEVSREEYGYAITDMSVTFAPYPVTAMEIQEQLGLRRRRNR